MFCPIFPTPSSGLSYCFIFVKTMTLLIKRPSFFDATLILMMSNIHSKFFFFKINHYDHEIYKSPLPETEVFFNNRLIWISPNNFTDISNVHYFFFVCLLVLFFFFRSLSYTCVIYNRSYYCLDILYIVHVHVKHLMDFKLVM